MTKKSSGLIFAKYKRVKNTDALAEYARQHPSCEVCRGDPMPTPHHLVPRSVGGDDEASNLLRLCWEHHVGNQGWHTLGGQRWFYRHRTLLSGEATAKVMRALRIDSENDPPLE